MAEPENGKDAGVEVPPGTLVVWSDVGCPWSHAAVARLWRLRRSMGLEGRVGVDHRAFPLELFNDRPTPRRVLMAEVPVAGAVEPSAGWQMWQDEVSHWPVTTLPALEAVQAAKEQSLEASERLDRALRVALFGQSRCISMRHVVLEVAEATEGVDAGALADALDDGRARRVVTAQWRQAESEEAVKGSPTVFAPGGLSAAHPGVSVRWEGEEGVGFPVVTADDGGAAWEALLEAAAGA